MRLISYLLFLSVLGCCDQSMADSQKSELKKYKQLYKKYQSRYNAFTDSARREDATKRSSYKEREAARNKDWERLQANSELSQNKLRAIEQEEKDREIQRKLDAGCHKCTNCN